VQPEWYRLRNQKHEIRSSHALNDGTGRARRRVDDHEVGFRGGGFDLPDEGRAHCLADVEHSVDKPNRPSVANLELATIAKNLRAGAWLAD
jgi:hypothetical protein